MYETCLINCRKMQSLSHKFSKMYASISFLMIFFFIIHCQVCSWLDKASDILMIVLKVK